MQDFCTSVIGLFFVLGGFEQPVDEFRHVWSKDRCPSPVIGTILGVDFLIVKVFRSHVTVFSNVARKVTVRSLMFSGYTSIAKIYRCESCEGCPYYGKCYKGNYSKKIQVSERFDYFREESRKNIVSEKGILLRINRSIQAEGVFGITKQDYGFKRFLMRGTENVRTEYLILAIAFNLNKLHYRIQSNRIGLSLFPLPESA